MTREESLAWRPDAEDEAFCALYGDWDPLTPTELRDLMAGYPEPCWVVGRWQSKRDASFVADLEEVTCIDLDGVWPLLDDGRRAWLRESLRRLHPDHPWQARLDA